MMRVKVACVSNKPPLVVQHAFSLNEFVGWSAHATFRGSCQTGVVLLMNFPGQDLGRDFSEAKVM